jgi:DHA3 family macrolide efflux protein-like MFS transporter
MTNYQPPANGFRTFLIVWFTQSISVFGTALTFFSVTIWLTQILYPLPEQKPELAFALAAVSLAAGVPIIFGAPLAGAWADRHDRKRTMMITDFSSGCLSVVIALLMVTQILNLGLLVVLVIVGAILGAFHNSAFDTSYAMLVPDKQLPRANGMMQTMWALSGILSPSIAAMIITLPELARQGIIQGGIGTALAPLKDGAPLAISIDALTFFLASTALIFLFIPSPKRTDLRASDGSKKSIWADVKEGALYIWYRRPLLWLLGTFTVMNFVFAPLGIFIPLLVKFNLVADWTARGMTFETAFALIATLGGVGGVMGGVFISAWGGLKKRRIYGILLPMILVGTGMILLGFSSWVYLTAILAMVGQGMTPLMNAHSQAIWQTQVPRELQGRVFSVRRLIAQFSSPISTALVGVFGGLFNPGAVIAVMGGIAILFCVAQLFNPYLLRVEDKEWLDQLAAKRTVPSL